jgi:hypothetical protein
MPPVVFEPTISVDERPQTYALDRAATRTGNVTYITCKLLLLEQETQKYEYTKWIKTFLDEYVAKSYIYT